MIDFLNDILRAQFYSPKFCPVLFRKIHVMAGVAEREYKVDFMITSVGRNDGSSHDPKNSLDGRLRAVDIRVRDPQTLERIIPVNVVKELREYHNVRLRKYGRFDSFFEHNVGKGPHIHSQTPKNLIITLKEE